MREHNERSALQRDIALASISKGNSSKLPRHRRLRVGSEAVCGLLRHAMQRHQEGELDAAEEMYRALLRTRALRPDALHYLGVLAHQRGQSEQGIALIQESVRIAPGRADPNSNLGNIYKECGRLGDAESCYRYALRLMPDHPEALGNLAVVLEAQDRLEEARVAYGVWVARDASDTRAQYLLGRFLCSHPRDRDDVEQAVVHFSAALVSDRNNLSALEALGMALYGLGRSSEAAGVYRDWSARDPENPIPRHMLSACGVTEAPSRAADDYIRQLFDGFAASFDTQLLENLGYRAPQALIGALDGAETDEALDVLDAGCGTGLCGPLIRRRARRLVGVDLSQGMLEKAHVRGCYDELRLEELTAHLQMRPHAYDLMLCADTLVYFGDLHPVICAAAAAVRPGGSIAFTLEALLSRSSSYRLSPSGRYQHTRHYVERVLTEAGLEGVNVRADNLRKEAGRWVDGWVVFARCGS